MDFSAQNLRMVKVGNQAGVLKIVDSDGQAVFVKKIPNTDISGLNSVDYAPLTLADSESILGLLGIQLEAESLKQALTTIITDFVECPHGEALSVLGVIGSRPEFRDFDLLTGFLLQQLDDGMSGLEKRYALLALALTRNVDARCVDRVIQHYESDHNLFETFPVMQFFQYHAEAVKQMPEGANFREKLANIDTLYRENILAALA